jgi:lipopolysaccharide transport system ATP-binding protein
MTTSDPIALKINSLTKSYKLYSSPMDNLMEAITGQHRHVEKRVLHNINLELRKGESLGILGRNGAGKSTLLKMIAGTLQPTGGDIKINGRVTAILELGSGFDPMISGRENIMMGGLCLGMSRAEVAAKTDRIIAFSELEAAIDQPFRTYSSGMQARLTFATAIHTDPDILIIDEALAVGDVRFQVKCFSRLKEIQTGGATILLVTHETNAMVRMCKRGLILENGTIYQDGPSDDVARAYTQLIFSKNDRDLVPSQSIVAAPRTEVHFQEDGLTRYGDRQVEITQAQLLDAGQKPCTRFKPWDPITFRMRLRFNCDHAGIVFGTGIRDRSANILWSTSSLLQTGNILSGMKGQEIEATFTGRVPLAGGTYFVFFSLADHKESVMLDFLENAIHLTVEDTPEVTQTSVVDFGVLYDQQIIENEKVT